MNTGRVHDSKESHTLARRRRGLRGGERSRERARLARIRGVDARTMRSTASESFARAGGTRGTRNRRTGVERTRVVSASSRPDRENSERAKRDMEALERRRDAASIVARVVKTQEAEPSGDKFQSGVVRIAGSKPPALTPEVMQDEVEKERLALLNEVLLIFVSGAILGPLLDHQHSRFNVLHYTEPVRVHFDALMAPMWQSPFGRMFDSVLPGFIKDAVRVAFVNENGVLETGWWVPPLFGVAAIVIGTGTTILDERRIRDSVRRARETEIRRGMHGIDEQVSRTSDLIDRCPGKPALGFMPGWMSVNWCISVFAFQYLASGVLASPQSPLVDGFLPYHLIDFVLCVWGVSTLYIFYRSAQGFFMASLTAVAGPVAEIVLINYGHLYSYAHPDVLGIPTWIPWVYFCGAPAVGNLSRQLRNELRDLSGLPGPTTRVVAYDKQKMKSSGALKSTAYSSLDRDKTVVNKNLKEIPKGRFTILPGGPIDVAVLVAKRREEEELARVLQSVRGGTQKRRRAVRRYVARQKDLKAGRKSVRDRIVGLLVRKKKEATDEDIDTEEGKTRRLLRIQREIERVEATLDEIERMKKLKNRLETIRLSLDDAAPPLGPKLRRLKSRLEDAVPAPLKPTWDALEDAIGESIGPIVRDKTPEGVRRMMEGAFDSEDDRRSYIERMNVELVEIQSEFQSELSRANRVMSTVPVESDKSAQE